MAWSAIVNSFNRGPGQIVLDVTYTDGAIKQIKNYVLGNVTLDAIKSMVAGEIAAFEAAKTFTIPTGTFDTTPTPPTQAQIDRSAYAADIRLRSQMDHAIAVGAKKSADQDYVDVNARLVANYIASHIDLF